MIKFFSNRLDCNRVEYSFWDKPSLMEDSKFLTWGNFISFLVDKNEEFLETFRNSLRDAELEKFSGYFWECPPISKEKLHEPFQFVLTKTTFFDGISQNYSAYQEHIDRNIGKEVCSFLNLPDPSGISDTTLIIPIPKTGKCYKSIASFVKNAPDNQWQDFWQEVGKSLSENLNSISNSDLRWLSTSGTGVSYLHVRICDKPKYYSFDKYKSPLPPAPTPKTSKERVLANLDKVCLDPTGSLANAEHLADRIFTNQQDYLDSFEGEENDGWYEVVHFLYLEGKLIELIPNEGINEVETREEIKRAIIDKIKQNHSGWKIEKESEIEVVKNKSKGIKHWKTGFSQEQWKEIETVLKNSSNKNYEKEIKKWYNPLDYPLPWTVSIIFFTFLIVITIIFWKRTKKKL